MEMQKPVLAYAVDSIRPIIQERKNNRQKAAERIGCFFVLQANGYGRLFLLEKEFRKK